MSLKIAILFLLGFSFCLLFFAFNCRALNVYGQTLSMWNQTYGGTAQDNCFSAVLTDDGGYTMVGYTYSFGSGDADIWLVKTDFYGNMEWNKTFGTANYEDAQHLIVTNDGGYIIVGRSTFGETGGDLWLIKTDSAGNMQWNETFGGVGDDKGWRIVRTSDGGYAIAGITASYGAGGNDFWLLKTDSLGTVQWNVTFGGSDDERARSLIATVDGGFLLTGWTRSFGAGEIDVWLVKTDADGNHQWNNTYGGPDIERVNSLSSTNDGGYIIAGNTASFGVGETDFYIVKTDNYGNMEWNKTYGGPAAETAFSIISTVDGGYGVVGSTSSFGAGDRDFWFVKSDALGNMLFNHSYGGEMSDSARSLTETDDGGYLIAGFTASFGEGENDFWLLKTDESGIIPEFPTIFITAVLLTLLALTITVTKRKVTF